MVIRYINMQPFMIITEIYLMFRELGNVLYNDSFHTENMLLDTKKVILCMKTVFI